MPKSELVIFGRSPFISQVDVPRLLQAYTTVSMNHFGKHYQVDTLFFFDDFYDGFYQPRRELMIPDWFLPHYFGTRYAVRPMERPLLGKQYQDGALCLGHRHFTVSVALNWAILEGFKKIYLVGIDHVESDRAFKHHDNIDAYAELTGQAHRELKEYVYNCTGHAEIYQCNPAVADQWQLPFKDLKDLYVQTQQTPAGTTPSTTDATGTASS